MGSAFMYSEATESTDSIAANPICGTGEMAERIRIFPWENTSLGPITAWPKESIFAVNQLLSSPLPSLVFWGPEFIGLYNDAFLPVYAGRHPQSLGQPAEAVWEELWHHIGSQLHAVLYEGKTIAFQKQPFTLTVGGEHSEVVVIEAGADKVPALAPGDLVRCCICGVGVTCGEGVRTSAGDAAIAEGGLGVLRGWRHGTVGTAIGGEQEAVD